MPKRRSSRYDLPRANAHDSLPISEETARSLRTEELLERQRQMAERQRQSERIYEANVLAERVAKVPLPEKPVKKSEPWRDSPLVVHVPKQSAQSEPTFTDDDVRVLRKAVDRERLLDPFSF